MRQTVCVRHSKMLCFENQKLNDMDCSTLCNVIIAHPDVQWINLSGNIIGDLGGNLLWSVLHGRNLRLLDLRDNLMSDQVIKRLLNKQFIKIHNDDPKSFEDYLEEIQQSSESLLIEKLSPDAYQRCVQEANEYTIAGVEHSIRFDKKAYELEEKSQDIMDEFLVEIKKERQYEKRYDPVKEGWYYREINH